MRKYNLVIVFVLLCLLFSSVSGNLQLKKTAPKEIVYGDTIEVQIDIINLDGIPKNDIYVKDVVDGFEPVDPPQFVVPSPPPGVIAWGPAYLDWWIDLEGFGAESIYYTVKPLMVGEISLGLAFAQYDGVYYDSNPFTVFVACDENGVCDTSIGESAVNCADCEGTVSDDVCNAITDGICDPDCIPQADPDCMPDKPKPEPTPDCSRNNICNPLCKKDADPDCKTPEEPKKEEPVDEPEIKNDEVITEPDKDADTKTKEETKKGFSSTLFIVLFLWIIFFGAIFVLWQKRKHKQEGNE